MRTLFARSIGTFHIRVSRGHGLYITTSHNARLLCFIAIGGPQTALFVIARWFSFTL